MGEWSRASLRFGLLGSATIVNAGRPKRSEAERCRSQWPGSLRGRLYGTWLHGDARGSFLHRTFLPPDPDREDANRLQLTGDVVYLTDRQRAIVDATLVKECLTQGWQLHACNVRTNHVHLVVSAARDGTFVRSRLKALA